MSVNQIYRGDSVILLIVGTVFITVGGGLAIFALVLGRLLDFSPAIPCLIGVAFVLFGAMYLVIGLRSRLKITPDGFSWRGVFSRTHSVQWKHVRKILPPPSGASPRLAAVAWQWDGSCVDINALWLNMRWMTRLRTPNHGRTQRMLIEGRKAFLSQNSR